MATNIDVDKVFTVTPEALGTFSAVRTHLDRLERAYGKDHKFHMTAASSWARVACNMFTTGAGFGNNTRITRDGELSFYVSTESGFVFGVVFHAVRRGCTATTCHAYCNDDGHVWSYGIPAMPILDHEHTWNYPMGAPTPGDWSMHS